VGWREQPSAEGGVAVGGDAAASERAAPPGPARGRDAAAPSARAEAELMAPEAAAMQELESAAEVAV
jgi:hypothetical protein